MRLVLWLFALMFVPASLWAAPNNDGRTPSETENVGKRLFFQRCSLCHLGMATKFKTYGPLLYGERMTELGDDAVRTKIMGGSVAMPGFKYALKSDEVDSIIAYLKTVKKADVDHGPTKQ
jgi:mono/diheme cytochrome c family protein